MKQALLSDLFYLAGADTERPCLSATTLYKANSSLAFSQLCLQPSREPLLELRDGFGLNLGKEMMDC
jgi:hypothetical protein